MKNIDNFLDSEGRVKQWPAKMALKMEALAYMGQKFGPDRYYTEHEVNDIIDQWHTFQDLFIFRRGMVDAGFLKRTETGSQYWREPEQSI